MNRGYFERWEEDYEFDPLVNLKAKFTIIGIAVALSFIFSLLLFIFGWGPPIASVAWKILWLPSYVGLAGVQFFFTIPLLTKIYNRGIWEATAIEHDLTAIIDLLSIGGMVGGLTIGIVTVLLAGLTVSVIIGAAVSVAFYVVGTLIFSRLMGFLQGVFFSLFGSAFLNYAAGLAISFKFGGDIGVWYILSWVAFTFLVLTAEIIAVLIKSIWENIRLRF